MYCALTAKHINLRVPRVRRRLELEPDAKNYKSAQLRLVILRSINHLTGERPIVTSYHSKRYHLQSYRPISDIVPTPPVP